MCRVYNYHVNFGFYQCLYPVEDVCCHADTCSTEKSALRILGRVRILDLLFDILYRDKSGEIAVLIDDGKLFLSCLSEDILGIIKRYALLGSDQPLTCHALTDLFIKISLKLQITVCDDTHKFLGTLLCYRHA